MRKISLFLIIVLAFPLLVFSGCGNGDKITAYTINASFNSAEMSLTADQKVNYINNSGTELSALKFNLFPAAFRKDSAFKPVSNANILRAYPGGMSYGDIKIQNVRLDGKTADYVICGQDQNILQINLPKKLGKGAAAVIEMDFKLSLPNVLHRFGYNQKTVNFGNWYPIMCAYANGGFYECEYYANGDPFFSDVADYEVNITYPGDYKIASSGETVSQNASASKTTVFTKMTKARDYAFVLSKDFSVKTASVLGTKINYFYYGDEAPEKSLKIAEESLKYFSATIGEYPYKELSVVETGFIYGGMEYSGLVFISDALAEKEYKEVIVHEIAHQWWYSAVGNNQLEEGYIDEGLAEYSTLLFFENNPQYEKTRAKMIKDTQGTYKIFYGIYNQVFGKADTTMNRKLDKFGSEFEYVSIAYVKGCLMFESLRQFSGDKMFFAFLKNLYRDNKFMIIGGEDLIKTAGSGGGIIRSFIDGTVIL